MGPPPLSVVVVDDERDIADLFADWLSGPHTVRTAYDGDSALELVDDAVDVVFLDRRMPGLSGDEVVRRLRRRGYDGQVAIVTAVEPDFDVLEMGFDTYLVKPVSRDELEATVSALATRRRYDRRVQRYFALVTRAALLESKKDDEELAGHAGYRRLQARIADLESDLDHAVDEFGTRDFEAMFHSLTGAVGAD